MLFTEPNCNRNIVGSQCDYKNKQKLPSDHLEKRFIYFKKLCGMGSGTHQMYV